MFSYFCWKPKTNSTTKNNSNKYDNGITINTDMLECIQWQHFKDTHREKALSNKTPALRKSTNMGVWAVGTSNQLFIRGS